MQQRVWCIIKTLELSNKEQSIIIFYKDFSLVKETLSNFISGLEKNDDYGLFREQIPTVFVHIKHTEEERHWLVCFFFFFIRFGPFYACIDFSGHESDVSSSFIQSAVQFCDYKRSFVPWLLIHPSRQKPQ